MKKTILILAMAIMSFSCSTEEQRIAAECKCYKVYYDYKPISYQGGSWVWGYVETSKELFSQSGTCDETDYILINGSKSYRIECR